jgi:hypothetical protein
VKGTAVAIAIASGALVVSALVSVIAVDVRQVGSDDAVVLGVTLPTLGLASFELDQRIEAASERFGPPATSHHELASTASTWFLDQGAVLTITAWDDTNTINALHAYVPTAGALTLDAFGGIIIGKSTVADVIAAWGPPSAERTSPYDDFVVVYAACRAGVPVVVKFDQAAAAGRASGPTGDATLLSQPVTSMLVAYAEASGTGGCRSPS